MYWFRFVFIAKFLLSNVSGFLEEENVLNQFAHFQKRFTKTYATVEEFQNRFQIFRYNLNNIFMHNMNSSHTFSLGVNQFTDLTTEEFKSQYASGLNRSNNFNLYGCKPYESDLVSDLPHTVDWRKKGAVTSVKNQGQCGSCWAFSSTGAVEGAWAIATDDLIDLSEQELVDCATGFSYGSHGCNGGEMERAFKFVIKNGLCLNSDYKYTSGDSTTKNRCQKCLAVAEITACYNVKSMDQLSLKAAVASQPVSVAIEADTHYFQSYSSGVLNSPTCGTNLDHGVLIVGYGEENGELYWLVKNSWADSWGEDGYFKIARSESREDAGICGIAVQPSFPLV